MVDYHIIEEKLNFWGFPHEPWHLTISGFGLDFNPRTIVMTWFTMILIIIFAYFATRKLDLRKPNALQYIFEEIYNFIQGLATQQVEPTKASAVISLVLTYFIFILFSNLLGLIPTLSSPTADINTTVGLALITFVMVQVYGIAFKGPLKHYGHYLKPSVVFLPINLVEEIAKPITLSFRLYGNIYAGELLIAVLLGLFPWYIDLGGGFIASAIWIGYSIFVGCIQAFIFTMLSIVYFGQSIGESH